MAPTVKNPAPEDEVSQQKMAREQRKPNWSQSENDPTRREWLALRDELEDLLDEVVRKQADLDFEEKQADRQGVRTAISAGNERRAAALRNVHSAMQRFSDVEDIPAMPSSSRRDLDEAIEQIRSSRHLGRYRQNDGFDSFDRRRATADRRERTDSARQDELAAYARRHGEQFDQIETAISDISARLERLDDVVGSDRVSSAHLSEIAVQIEQLTDIVEVLAGKVNERSAFQTVEQQIEGLRLAIDGMGQTDFSGMEQRIGLLSESFERLSQLQAEQHAAQSSLMRQLSEDETSEKFTAIEDGVRNIYDRLDSMSSMDLNESLRSVFDRIDLLEQNVATPTPLLQRLTNDITDLTSAIKSSKGPAVTSVITTRIDALNDRISDLENAPAPEKTDPALFDKAIAKGIDDALSPRLAELDVKIGGIANGLKSRAVKLESSPQLEQQIRQLTEKLDQTRTDLEQLRANADQGNGAVAPDNEALAELVARKASQAVANATQQGNKLTADLLKKLESHITDLIEKAPQAVNADFSPLEEGIRKVNSRLAELETSVKSSAAAANRTAQAVAQQAPDLTSMAEPRASKTEVAEPPVPPIIKRRAHPGLDPELDTDTDRGMEKSHLLAELRDAMPRRPSDEAPLNAPAFPDPRPDPYAAPSSQKAVPVPGHLKETEDTTPDFASHREAEARPRAAFDIDSVVPPPAPVSSFDMPEEDQFAGFGSRPSARLPEQDPDEVQSRFGQRSSFDDSPTSSASVSRSTFIAAARRAAQANNPDMAEAGSNSLIGRALSRFQRKKTAESEAEAADQLPFAEPEVTEQPEVAEKPQRKGRFSLRRAREQEAERAEPEMEAIVADDDEEGLDIVAQNESFLNRYRRPILLGLTAIAVSLLALNLISQRLSGPAPQQPAAMAEPPAMTEDAGANVDPAPVGSIDQTQLSAPEANVRMIDPAPLLDMPAALEQASLSPQSMLAAPAMDPVPMPDEGIGPIELRQAAADGNAKAEYEVAAIYAEGRAVAQDMDKASQWYGRSAEQGFAPAMYLLANMYENGTGIDKDVEQAAYWYERGAELGNRMSMHNLAALNASGGLGDQDFKKAAYWFERAAALGLTDSQFNLGMLNARGLGVAQDLPTSYKWFSIAAAAGDQDALQAKSDVARSLDADTVARLDAEVANWAPQPVDIKANFAPIGTWSDHFDPGPAIDNHDVIQKVQAALNKLGYDAGTADGLIGPKTRDAIGAFEEATGMSVSKEINPRLLAVLGSQPV
ncbi:MAG: SEL1-like repeat protein [Hyphomicrobiaceae bacterium]|nr:SEL1-like repeat protein [Hyphomicrobiaceae bacterium]